MGKGDPCPNCGKPLEFDYLIICMRCDIAYRKKLKAMLQKPKVN